MSRPRVLFVGRRRGALLAAARLDVEVILLDDAGRPERAAGAHAGAKVDFADLEGCVAAAERLTRTKPVDAVVAVVERAVLPAAAIREALGVVGPSVEDALPWRDKMAMKHAIEDAGIPCARSVPVEAGTDPAALVSALGLPMVLKPRASSGSRGTVVARDLAQVSAALQDGWMAESFVRGMELSVESFVVEGQPRWVNVTDYLLPGWANVVPAAHGSRIENAVRALNEEAIAALGVEDGITHLEAFVIDDGETVEVVFGELAQRPPGGYLMELIARAWGFDPWLALLCIALGRPVSFPETAARSAGVWFLHPGEGEVLGVEGLDEARNVPGVIAVDCALEVGQRISRRDGTGQHEGRVLAVTDDHASSARALREAMACLRVKTRAVA